MSKGREKISTTDDGDWQPAAQTDMKAAIAKAAEPFEQVKLTKQTWWDMREAVISLVRSAKSKEELEAGVIELFNRI